jgi:hypothetical protein
MNCPGRTAKIPDCGQPTKSASDLGINPLLQQHFLIFFQLLAIVQAFVLVFVDPLAV